MPGRLSLSGRPLIIGPTALLRRLAWRRAAWFLVLALWQLRGAISRCMPLCLLHLRLLLTQLNILVCLIGLAR